MKNTREILEDRHLLGSIMKKVSMVKSTREITLESRNILAQESDSDCSIAKVGENDKWFKIPIKLHEKTVTLKFEN